jgi:hypothetical protein
VAAAEGWGAYSGTMQVTTTELALAGAAAAALVLLVALVVRWRVRRAATRRVLEIALRIEREHGP